MTRLVSFSCHRFPRNSFPTVWTKENPQPFKFSFRGSLLPLPLPVTRYLPYIIVGLATASALAVAYTTVILPSANLTTPKVTWTTSPLTISFAATEGSGSATDTFNCSLSTGPIVTRTVSNSPQIIQLTTSPTSFGNCGSSLTQLTVSATCLVLADQCRGTYDGVVQIRQPTNYRNLASPLHVKIVVG